MDKNYKKILNGNGLIENFYSLLWLKPNPEPINFDFRLPNTIVFKNHYPQ